MASYPRFEASFKRIFGEDVALGEQADEFFVRFYEHFMARSADVREKFAHTDMARQASMLRQSMLHLLHFYVTDTVTEPMRRFASTHQRLRIPNALYDEWLEALVATASQFDPEFDEATGFEWRLALTPGISYMKLWSASERNPHDGP